MQLSKMGTIVKKCWLNLPNHYSNCILDEFVIMPNHIHGIVGIGDDRNNDHIPVETGLGFVETGLSARG